MASTPAVKRQPEPLGKTERSCPICESGDLEYEFAVEAAPVCKCQDCGLLFLNPKPLPAPNPAPLRLSSPDLPDWCAEIAAARLDQLIRYSGLKSGTLLIVGNDPHLAVEAKKRGLTAIAMNVKQFESADRFDLPGRLDACVLFQALEQMGNPVRALQTVRLLLQDGGSLMIVSPTIDSRAARLFRGSWWEFKRSNLFYFSADTLQNLLSKAGFGDSFIQADHTPISLNYLRQRFAEYQQAGKRVQIGRALASISPTRRNKAFGLVHSQTTFLARAKPLSTARLLSVIVPVYNERTTVMELLDRLLSKQIDGVEIEVIIVESNSTDGTRELVRRYTDHPRVRLILEDKARGKGFAVRSGLRVAKGDIVLFQDADLEYDVDDYDALIAPILKYRANFVLGSRHMAMNSWKIRSFSDSPAVSAYFNLGHVLLLAMFNIVYAQKLTDPFTMFKVFRRDCLYGLTFECDRFDFDNEILIKLLRKGYKVTEIPVNYVSRSIQEGKKITLFLDPLRWIRALIKFRNSQLYGSDGE